MMTCDMLGIPNGGVATPDRPGPAPHDTPLVSTTRALVAQRARRRLDDADRVRVLRERRHVMVAALCFLAFVVLLSVPMGLIVYSALSLSAAIGLISFAHAVDLHFGWGYGHLYRVPTHAARLDRLAARVVSSLEVSAPRDAEPPKVRVLPPA